MRCSTRTARRPVVYRTRPIGGFMNEFMNTPVNDLMRDSRITTTKPAVNVIENTDAFLIHMAIPGFSKEQIAINIKDGLLTIKNKEDIKSDRKYRLKEFDYGSFKRTFRLADSIDINQTKAEMNQGVLSITLNKKEEQKPRTIEIS